MKVTRLDYDIKSLYKALLPQEPPSGLLAYIRPNISGASTFLEILLKTFRQFIVAKRTNYFLEIMPKICIQTPEVAMQGE